MELYRVLGDKIDVVLLDMTMPVMGGEETFRQLKALRPDISVVLSSGYNEVEAVRRFAGKGLAGFIQKPYSALTLVEKIRAGAERDARNRAELILSVLCRAADLGAAPERDLDGLASQLVVRKTRAVGHGLAKFFDVLGGWHLPFRDGRQNP